MNGENNRVVVIVGGGIAGLSAAISLADMGIEVILIEHNKHLGGHAAEWACMATDECAKCSACLVQDQMWEAICHPHIQVVLGGEVSSFRGIVGSYQLSVKPSHCDESQRPPWAGFVLEKPREISAGCVVLATGFDEYNASDNQLLGYGHLEGVTTSKDLDRILRKDDLSSYLPDSQETCRLAFIQCVGSRDRSSGREYCSQFCCRTTIRLARRLIYLKPKVEVTIFYIDLQIMSKEFNSFYQQSSEKISFIQGVPAEVMQGKERPLRLFSVVPGSSHATAMEFDRVVLAIGLSPTVSQESLAQTFGLKLNEFGYFAAIGAKSSVAVANSGVFLIGGCAGPTDIQGSRKQALAAATRVAKVLRSRTLQQKSVQAYTSTSIATST